MNMKTKYLLIIFLTLFILSSATQGNNRCSDGCMSCPSGPRNCSQCSSGFFLQDSQCRRCPPGCSSCSLGTDMKPNCTSCVTGAQMNTLRQCFMCSPSCHTCSNNPQNCTHCYPGDQLVGGTCRRISGCSAPCLTCNGNGTCATCPDGSHLMSQTCRRCPFPCGKCEMINGTIDCLECVKGFMQNENGTCIPCSPNCMQCSNSTCTKCREGFYYSGSGCSRCDHSCMTCIGGANICNSCMRPRTLINSTCVLCNRPCQKCSPSDSSLCTQCIEPFSLYPNSTNKCYRCKQDLCMRCDQNSTTTCITCRFGATPINGICMRCPPLCVRCQIDTNSTNNTNSSKPPLICLECQKRRTLLNGKCVQCQRGCLTCSNINQSVCLECQPGSFNERGVCRRCPPGCNDCASPDRCRQLSDGFIQLSNGMIGRCRPGCNKCNPQAPESCLQCGPRFYLDGINCKKCAKGCLACNPSNSSQCTQCSERDHLISNQCVSCAQSCLTCNSANTSNCLTCKRGAILQNGTCVNPCQTNCVECNPSSTKMCLKCRYGFALREGGNCVKCLGNCGGSCDPRNLDVCLDCAIGFQLIDTTCVKCPDGCERCLDGKCDRCAERFQLKQVNNTFVCSPRCRFPCSTCTDTTCLTCSDNFIMNNTTKMCVPDLSCNPNCSFCPPGSEKLGNGTCVPCINNCAACGNGTCFECIDGYFQQNGSCVSCPQNCLKCVDNSTCLMCKKGYLREMLSQGDTIQQSVFSDTCTPCDSNCQSCNILPNLCSDCPDNFKMSNTRCQSKKNVGYKFQLKANYTDFVQNGKHQSLAQKMSQFTKKSQDDIGFNTLKQGSVITDGSINIPTGSDPNQVSNLLQSNINNLGYQVLSFSVGIYDQNGNQLPPPPRPNLPLIIGLAVGLTALAIIIGVAIYCVCRKKQQSITMMPIDGQMLAGSPGSPDNSYNNPNVPYQQTNSNMSPNPYIYNNSSPMDSNVKVLYS